MNRCRTVVTLDFNLNLYMNIVDIMDARLDKSLQHQKYRSASCYSDHLKKGDTEVLMTVVSTMINLNKKGLLTLSNRRRSS
jgi:hypothetical protein